MPLVLNGTTGVSSVDGSASTPALQGSDTNTGVFFPAVDTVAISTGGSERMRVDSLGNLGVATNSPVTVLDVNGNFLTRGVNYTYQPTPTSLSVSQSLSAAQLLTGILVNTSGTGSWTMPTGTSLDAGLPSLPVDAAFDFIIINQAGAGPTIAGNTGVTTVGSMGPVGAGVSARFIVRKTASATYVVYRAA